MSAIDSRPVSELFADALKQLSKLMHNELQLARAEIMSRGTIADLRREMATKDDINRHDTKLTKFEEREIDKRPQLEVRVSAIEKHLDLDRKIAA